MPKQLQDFYLFPIYQDRETYDNQPGDNADAPPWDGKRKLQPWVDPNPKQTMTFIGIGKVAIYSAAIEMAANGTYAVGADGQPKVAQMAIPFAEATTPNFLPSKGIVPTVPDLTGGDPSSAMVENARMMVENAGKMQSIPLNLPEGARVRWAPGLSGIPVVYLAGEPLPEEQGAVGQANTLGQVLRIVQQIAQKVGVS